MGFVLLTHEDGPHLLRLVERLNALYDEPLIVCHHDVSRSAAPKLPGDVHFVVDAVRTQWGGWSIVEAWMAALRVFAQQPSVPDWVTLLSGSDYPTASAATVFSQLEGEAADAHLEFRSVELGSADPWVRNRAGRYLGWRWWLGPLAPERRVNRSVGPTGPLATRLLSPFGRGLDCYAGSMWFSANHKAVDALLDSGSRMPRLARRYRHVFCPDESYPHTVLGNTPGVVVCAHSHRYVDWSPGHPKTLRDDDLSAIENSAAWFARKFASNCSGPVCDRVDEMVGLTA
ncbi:MAG: beta-1,6-N-acetylglucosaminyltransferase [Acidimicrobiales bacterium]|jgi:hypothetical protein